MSTRIRDWLSTEELRALTRKSDWRGAWVLLRGWLVVGLSFAALLHWPTPLVFALVVLVLATQQLVFAVITHEAAHRTLFKTSGLNRHLADWLCARPIWLDVERYRQHHMQHHAHTGTARDPDMSLVQPYPCSRQSLLRKFARDLVGVTGLKRLLGLLLMDFGQMRYTVSGDVHWLPREARGLRSSLSQGVRHFVPVVLANLALLLVLAAAGAAWAYLAWVVAYVGPFSVLIRLRSIAEHACLPGGDNMLENTRTTAAGWLARLSIAPLHVNYHREHHLVASVPCYRLPEMHRLMRARLQEPAAPSYWQVLKLAGSR